MPIAHEIPHLGDRQPFLTFMVVVTLRINIHMKTLSSHLRAFSLSRLSLHHLPPRYEPQSTVDEKPGNGNQKKRKTP